jgi:predicted permease
MQSFWQDLRFGLRILAKNPGFTVIAILTLALGIGANTAIFSLTDQVLLRLLPVERPEELVVLHSPGPKTGHTWSDSDGGASFSYPLYKELRAHSEVFTGLLARFAIDVNVSGQGQTEHANGELVSGNYFEVLGVRPALGRVFTSEDETSPGANPLAVLSYGYWTRRLGADPGVLNKQFTVNGTLLTVVGVARAGFSGVQIGQVPDFFVPITMKAQMTPNWNGLDDHKDHWLAMLGRIKPGLTRERAEAGLQPAFHAILESEVPLMKYSGDRLKQFLARKILLDPGSHGRPILQKEAQEPLIFLLAMVGLVLLIACANLASLLVARGEARQREIAVRLALGAGRWRLVRQLLTESLLVSLGGGLAGLVVASWSLSGLVSSIPESTGMLGIHEQLDLRVLAFALGLSLLTGIFFGLAPALRSTRAELQTTLKDQGTSVSASVANVRLRKALIVSQVALTAVLLTSAGMFARSMVNLRREKLGVRTEHVLQFTLAPELNRYSPAQSIALFDRMREGMAALPGVRGVSAAEIQVFADSDSSSNFTVEGYTPTENEEMHFQRNSIGPNFFSTMGIPLLAGREFSNADAASAPPVAIINETLQQRCFKGREAIGSHVGFGSGKGTKLNIEIVGVVKDSKHSTVRDKIKPFIYFPYAQDAKLGRLTFYLRTEQDPISMATTLRQSVAGFDANLPVEGMKTLTAQVDESVYADRLVMFLSVCLALLAALLAAVGLYGVMAYVVARRTREIGIRMALGATRQNVAWLVLRDVVGMTTLGLAIGLAAAFGAGRVIESELFGVKAGDALVYVLAAGALAFVAVLAGWLPARKAAGVDPMVALRYE